MPSFVLLQEREGKDPGYAFFTDLRVLLRAVVCYIMFRVRDAWEIPLPEDVERPPVPLHVEFEGTDMTFKLPA